MDAQRPSSAERPPATLSHSTYSNNAAHGFSRQHNGNVNGNVTNNIGFIYNESSKHSDSRLGTRLKEQELLRAAAEGQTPRVGLFLDQLVNTECRSEHGLTPLHLAVLGGFEDTISLLLRRGADVNAATSSGETSLHFAALKSRSNVVRQLLDGRADIHRSSRNLGYALHCASYAGDAAIFELLVARSASLVDYGTVSPRILRSIHRYGSLSAEPHGAQTSAGLLIDGVIECQPCHIAIIGGHSSLLLGGLLQPPGNPFHDNPCTFSSVREKSAQHILHDKSAETVAHTVALAVLADKTDMLRALLAYGMSPDTQDSEGQTPLMLAVRHAHVHCMNALLDHRADLEIADKYGMNAIDYAKEASNATVADVLQRRGLLPIVQQNEFTAELGMVTGGTMSYHTVGSTTGFSNYHTARSILSSLDDEIPGSSEIVLTSVPRDMRAIPAEGSDSQLALGPKPTYRPLIASIEHAPLDAVDPDKQLRERGQAELNKLKAFIEQQTISACHVLSGKPEDELVFLPIGCIERYFLDNRVGINHGLMATFDLVDSIDLNPTSSQIADCCPRIFCILMLLGELRFIRHFFDHPSLYDIRLPFATEPAEFPDISADFFHAFYAIQWRFCSPPMQAKWGQEFAPECVLPIEHMSSLVRNDIMTAHKVIVNGTHDRLRRKSNSGAVVTEPGPAQSHCYAIRTFKQLHAAAAPGSSVSQGLKDLFEDAQHSSDAALRCFGSFIYQDTLSVVLEYHDACTLSSYFRTSSPPSGAEAILNFWKKMLSLFSALRCLHDTKATVTRENYRSRSWLNLDSIIVCSIPESESSQPEFKLDVFGAGTGFAANSSVDSDGSGNTDYEAPEIFMTEASQTPSSRASHDVWALGCILSETAVWVAFGWQGLASYRKHRRNAVTSSERGEENASFHDGRAKLETVADWHRKLQLSLPATDQVTAPLLSEIVDRMLHHAWHTRPAFTELESKARQVIDRAEASALLHPGRSYGIATRNETHGSQMSIPVEIRSSGTIDNLNEMTVEGSGLPGHENVDTQRVVSSPPATNSAGAGPLKTTSNAAQSRGSNLESEFERNLQQAYPINPAQELPSSEVPTLSREQAKIWYNEQKTFRGAAGALPHSYLLRWLYDRDHVFIVDDSQSMRVHWEDVAEIVQILAYLVKSTDPDGLEMYFTSSEKSVRTRKSSDLARAIREVGKQVKGHQAKGATSLDPTLNRILNNYVRQLKERSRIPFRSKTLRKLTILVLTDGVLEAGDEDHLFQTIRNLHGSLRDAGMLRTQVGISFIKFGKDVLGLDRLQRLDMMTETSDLALDFVDTEPSTGNIWKMLLGAIDQKFDEEHEPRNTNASRPMASAG